MLIFIHISKTGGSTLRDLLHWNYDGQSYNIKSFDGILPFLAQADAEKLRWKCLQGQLFYGIHAYIPAPCTYLTILREPIARVISHYYYLDVRRKRAGLPPLKLSLEQFLELEPFQAYTQLNLLAGGPTVEAALRRPLPPDALEQAIAHIEADFPIVGILERYDESLLLMKRHFGWARAFYARKNENRGHPRYQDLPAHQQQLLQRVCEPELALYDYARKRLEQQLSQQGDDFWRELDHLKRSNRRFGALYRWARPLQKTPLWFWARDLLRKINLNA